MLRRLAPALVTLVWLAFAMRLATWGTALVPDAIKAKITYPQFLIACQVTTLAVGLALTWLLVRAPRQTLGLRRPRPAQLTAILLLAPITYLVASLTAVRIALPYLLEELAQRGPGVAREAAGEMGRQLAQGPLLTTLLWGALLAAASEELLFRGALWSTIEGLVPKPAAALGLTAAPPPARSRGWLTTVRLRESAPGLIATVTSAALFGVLHYDMKGAVGLVHAIATTCLGLACGLARHRTGNTIAAILLHFLYNTIVIANSRRVFGHAADSLLAGVPDAVVYLAGAGLLGALGLFLVLRRARRRAAVVGFAP